MKTALNTEKPILYLLPGLHGTSDLFGPLAEVLGGFMEVQAVEYPLDEPLGYGRLLEIVTHDILKEKPYFILGESFSGPLAVMAGAKMPENLLGVILAGSFVTSPVPRWVSRFRPLLRSRILDLRPGPLITDRLLGKSCSDKTRRWVHNTLPHLKKDVLATRIESVLNVNVREELKGIKAPVLYIAGSGDWLVSGKSIDAVWLCRPDVQIKVLDGGHMILQTSPGKAAEAIREFCGRVTSDWVNREKRTVKAQ